MIEIRTYHLYSVKYCRKSLVEQFNFTSIHNDVKFFLLAILLVKLLAILVLCKFRIRILYRRN